METLFQFFLLDICGNTFYYSMQILQYMILPVFAILGLFGVCLMKVKKRCKGEKETPNPFQKMEKPKKK